MEEWLKCKSCGVTYNIDSAVPKKLPCGHVICSKCTEPPSTKCYVCKADFGSDLLVDSETLDVVKSVCNFCRTQLWTKCCQHCNRNICEKCLAVHTVIDDKLLPREVLSLRDNTRALENICKDEIYVKEVKASGELVIELINQEYDRRQKALERRRQDIISRVRAQSIQNEKQHHDWIKRTEAVLSEARDLLDSTMKHLESNKGDQLKIDEFTKRDAILIFCSKKVPDLSKVVCKYADSDFERLLSSSEELSFLKYNIDITLPPKKTEIDTTRPSSVSNPTNTQSGSKCTRSIRKARTTHVQGGTTERASPIQSEDDAFNFFKGLFDTLNDIKKECTDTESVGDGSVPKSSTNDQRCATNVKPAIQMLTPRLILPSS